jgi:hypothetical protein
MGMGVYWRLQQYGHMGEGVESLFRQFSKPPLSAYGLVSTAGVYGVENVRAGMRKAIVLLKFVGRGQQPLLSAAPPFDGSASPIDYLTMRNLHCMDSSAMMT